MVRVASGEDVDRLLALELGRLGLSLSEWVAQGRRCDFDSDRAHRLWVLYGPENDGTHACP